MTFLIFLALTFFIKRREWLYRRNGKTREQYHAFLKTNLNSLQFSSFLTNQFISIAFLDLIVLMVLSAIIAPIHFGYSDNPFSTALDVVISWGFGGCLPLILVTPFIMLFSYTRTHKDTKMDLVINLLGIVGVGLVYLEGLYQIIYRGMDLIKNLLANAV